MNAAIADSQDEQLQQFSTRLAGLEGELRHLTRTVQLLVSAVDPEELAALLRLQQSSPSNAELKAWASASAAPPELAAVQEERPW